MPLFQAILHPSSSKVTEGLCIKDTTTIDYTFGTYSPLTEMFEDYYYIAYDDTNEVGDYVVVPVGKDNHHSIAEVVKIEYFAEESVPLPLEKTKHIIRICTDDDFDSMIENEQ